MKTLRDIIYKAGIEKISGSADIEIREMQFDSRLVQKGDVFVAVAGTHADGHEFIQQAIRQGAIAIVCEHLPDNIAGGITYVRVKDSSHALGVIASNYFDNPSGNLHLIGITGTNGKTTIATLLFRLFTLLGFGCGLLSTIRNMIMDEEIPSTHTTPDAIQINRTLREMVDRGASYCFMEVSSHAVVQKRIAGLTFAGGIFTNITHDHLDYHKSFEEYLIAKKTFFDDLPSGAFALINVDDRNGAVMVQNTKASIKSYALKSNADFRCKVLENRFEGLHLVIDAHELHCRLPGEFNAYNLLAVYGAACLLGQEPDELLVLLSGLEPAEGRFQTIHGADNITGIVDYAHTPDALKNVLETINRIRTGNERLITVVGAGGDRDTTKRPIMAKISAISSDQVILTSDNPRSEDPQEIIKQMKEGIEPEDRRKVISILNRKEAIEAACKMARTGDIILVAGKGHETYQEIKGVKYPFDDRKLLEEMLLANK